MRVRNGWYLMKWLKQNLGKNDYHVKKGQKTTHKNVNLMRYQTYYTILWPTG